MIRHKWVIQKGNAINLPSHGNHVLGALGLTCSQRLRFWGPWFTDTFRTGIKALRQGATLRMPVAPLIQFPTNIVLQFLLSCADAFAICFFGFKFLRVRVTCGTIHASWWLCLWLYLIIKPHFDTFRSILMCQGATPPEVINKRRSKSWRKPEPPTVCARYHYKIVQAPKRPKKALQPQSSTHQVYVTICRWI